jgi:hypothetical protein
MPPLEAKKMLFRNVAGIRGWRKRRGEAEVKLMFIDVRKAHLNGICEEEEWVELPEEFWEWGRFARLRRWLYGMRKAAAGWEEDYSSRLERCGFRTGKAAPTVFFNHATGVRVVVHGDDFTFSGTRRELEKMQARMSEWYEVKDRGIMGSGVDEVRDVTILGRRLRWVEGGLEYEADEKHREELMKMEGLTELCFSSASYSRPPSTHLNLRPKIVTSRTSSTPLPMIPRSFTSYHSLILACIFSNSRLVPLKVKSSP